MLRLAPFRSRNGFTLVELLVVIAILMLLVAMLLPAIQKVRESANRVVCASHLRTIGQAMSLYLAANQQRFPTGGGDASYNLGAGEKGMPRSLTAAGLPASRAEQDWGWMYQILPYMENDTLWRHRQGPLSPFILAPYGIDIPGDATVAETTIETYFCPSRRGPQALLAEFGKRAMNDYAGNIGAFTLYLENGHYHSACANASGYKEGKPKNPFRNGIFVKSRYKFDNSYKAVDEVIHIRDVSDGMANTIVAADKRMNQSHYGSPQFGDVDGYVAGFIADTLRAGAKPPARDWENDDPNAASDRFGSSHPFSINVLFCDGSVRQVSYNIPENKVACQVYNDMLKVWQIYMLPVSPTEPPQGAPHAGPFYPPYSIELTLFQRLCHRADGGRVELSLIED